jgi:hypothetical protein
MNSTTTATPSPTRDSADPTCQRHNAPPPKTPRWKPTPSKRCFSWPVPATPAAATTTSRTSLLLLLLRRRRRRRPARQSGSLCPGLAVVVVAHRYRRRCRHRRRLRPRTRSSRYRAEAEEEAEAEAASSTVWAVAVVAVALMVPAVGTVSAPDWLRRLIHSPATLMAAPFILPLPLSLPLDPRLPRPTLHSPPPFRPNRRHRYDER